MLTMKADGCGVVLMEEVVGIDRRILVAEKAPYT